MTEPSEAAKRKACELANEGMGPDVTKYKVTEVEAYEPLRALALYIDEVDLVARDLEDGAFRLARPVIREMARSLMLPDPVDLDEELAREVAKNFGRGPHMANETAHHAALATIKRLREQGRLTDGSV